MSGGAGWQGGSRAVYGTWLVAVGIAVAVGGTWLTVAVPDKDGSAVPWAFALIPLLAGVFVAGAAIVFGRVDLRLDDTGVHLSFGPWGWPRRHIGWADVAAVRELDVRALPWGGWGYRWNPWRKGTAALMRQGPGLEFTLVDDGVLVVTVDDAESGLAAAMSWVRPPSCS
jgi:hypothetical protein